ncbi:MAG: AAA domain-containing protein [Chitinophagaceae bacterium]
MDYFKQLRELLQIEKNEDRKQYETISAQTSVAQRRANGIAWYPIAIRGSEMGRGDYLVLEVERTTHTDVAHQFRFGVPAVLFSQHDPKNCRLEGVVNYQSGNKMKLSLRSDELPDWADDGKLGIDILFDNNSYEEMEAALKKAASILDQPKEGRLVQVLTGEAQPSFQQELSFQPYPTLNNFQNAAVQKILAANDLAIVHGPPGTGKTTTLVKGIKALVEQGNKKILVVAPSNTAVDLLSEKLADEGLNVLRVGNPARVSEKLISLTLDSKVSQHHSVKEIKKLRKQANEFRDMAHKYKRSFGRAEREQRKLLFAEARNIMKQVEQTEQYIVDDLLNRAQVITATPVGANHYTVRHLQYDVAVIDEAGQALEPSCWIPVLKARKLVMAGDHCQLPPTILSEEAAKKGLNQTLMEKNVRLHPEAVVLLEEQYRMHESIMQYASEIFYENKLKANSAVATHTLFDDDEPLLFIDTAGCGFEEKLEGTSTSNPEEAAFLLRHLSGMVDLLNSRNAKGKFPTVAVISPYREQVRILKDLLQHNPVLAQQAAHISVNTIDGFQGQERDIVYISLTRSNPDNRIGFLSDIRRMNVAMTRARKKLVVIGDSGTLSQFPFYAGFIAHAERKEGYKSAWEFMEV